MNTSHGLLVPVAILVLLAGVCSSRAGSPHEWSNTSGTTIQAEFVRLDDEKLTIRKEGQEYEIPIGNLSLASRKLARDLAGDQPADPLDPQRDVSPSSSPGDGTSNFGEQEDPDHQRKLARHLLEGGGWVRVREVENAGPLLRDVQRLPEGRITLVAFGNSQAIFGDVEARLLNGCEDVEHLVIENGRMRALPLASLKNLRIADLRHCSIEATELRELAGLDHLGEVRITNARLPLGEQIVDTLAECGNVHLVDLYRSGVEGGALSGLGNLRSLRELGIGGNPIEPGDLDFLAECDSIEILRLPVNNWTGHSFAFLPEMRALRFVEIAECTPSRAMFEALADCAGLDELYLRSAALDESMLEPLAGHRRLRVLAFPWTKVSSGKLYQAGELPALQTLDAYESPLSDVEMQSLVLACPHLRRLHCKASDLSVTGYTALAQLKQLEQLVLGDPKNIDAAGLEAIAKIRSLKELRLGKCPLGDAELAALSGLKRSLHEFHAHETRLSEESIGFLSEFKALKVLRISGSRVTEEMREKLRVALQGCDVGS